MRTRTLPLLSVAAILAFAPPALAQEVRGTLVERGGAGVPGASVILQDEAGRAADRVLTGEDGGFVVRASAAGRYRLLVRRIGFGDQRSPLVELAAGQTLPIQLTASQRPVALGAITVSAGKECSTRPEAGQAAAAVWEEVRKALEEAVWTEATRDFAYDLLMHDRLLSLETGEVLREKQVQVTVAGALPFYAAAPESLSVHGYIRENADRSYTYHGLDARVLLSEAFLNTHCLRVAEPRADRPGMVGLAFEPAGGRRQPDVAGVLWLDAASAELRELEYNYTRHLQFPTLPTAPFGGRMEFRRLHTGAWAVTRWSIRMPDFTQGLDENELRGRTRELILSRPPDRFPEEERKRAFEIVGTEVRELGGTVVGGVGTSRTAMPDPAQPMARVGSTAEPGGR